MTRCTLGVGCDEYGFCYAVANGQPDRCGRPEPAPGSPEAIEQAELLEAMACIYPGDPDGTLAREACELRGVPYEPPEVIVTYD